MALSARDFSFAWDGWADQDETPICFLDGGGGGERRGREMFLNFPAIPKSLSCGGKAGCPTNIDSVNLVKGCSEVLLFTILTPALAFLTPYK